MPIPLGILAVAGAGGGALSNSYDLLQTTLITANTSSVIFSNLNTYSDYKHLQLRATMRTQDATSMRFVINGDDGTNSYASHFFGGDGGGFLNPSSINQNTIEFANVNTDTGAPTNAFAPAVLDLLDFSNTSKNKVFRCFSGRDNIGGNPRIAFYSGLWRNTNAITQIELRPSFLNIVSGSRFSLYGIKG